MKRWAKGPIACGIVTLGVGLCARDARADEVVGGGTNETKEKDEGAADAGARKEHVRFDLGVGLAGVGLFGTAAGNRGISVGALGYPLAAVYFTGVEAHLAGPAWLVMRVTGSLGSSDLGGMSTSHWAASGAVGPRIEAPIFEKVEAGGYALFEGGYTRMNQDDLPAVGSGHVGGKAGASVHFRPTALFGIRLALDIFRGGYAWTVGDAPESETWSSEVTASPQAEMTFTF